MIDTVIVYHPFTGVRACNRIAYVCAWLLGERFQVPYIITTDEKQATSASRCISYAAEIPGSIFIPCTYLESGTAWIDMGINNLPPPTGLWNGIPTLFDAGEENVLINFDLISAIFYLLSRYEEYHPFTGDKHGRYPATQSILYQNDWLRRPVADEWVHALKNVLQQEWNEPLPEMQFSFLPTYDIDMAYSHRYKGIGRIAGAYLRAMLKGDVSQINERTQVLKKKKTDPYDSFALIHELNTLHGLRPLYFILCGLRTTAYDKNIHPQHPAMKRIIRQLDKDGVLGIHPSYYATKAETMGKEKKVLEEVAAHTVYISRQHYIRLSVPDTFRMLLRNGITDDYSMGYGTQLGFRAGTGCSFLWYDLENETATQLRIHPFCFMDTTAHYDLGLTAGQAFDELYKMETILRRTNSTLVTVFHNFSLGTEMEWNGWQEAYEQFLKQF